MANESPIHMRNLKFLLTEVYKFLSGLSAAHNCPYDLRNSRILVSKHKSTIKYGINTFAFKGP